MVNGIEFDVFAMKNGIRYKIKTITINDVSHFLIDSLMDGIGKIIGAIDNNSNGGESNE